jgi:RNA polymerase sigma-70 factor (ECF subfamily)
MDPGEAELVARLRQGETGVLAELFSRHRERLWKLVHFRLHPRLAARLDADDVLQEAYLAATTRLDHLLKSPAGSVFVWLRLIVLQTLTQLHRQHLGTGKRDAHREVSLQYGPEGRSTAASLAAQFLGSFTSPSGVVMRAEMAARLEAAIDAMHPVDREVLALRHFEELTNQEIAEVLGLEPTAASNRYVRALQRLKQILSETSEGREQQP